MWDFILFETLYNSINHCTDLCNIARLLRDSGYHVAIADVFHEAEYCRVEGIPHVKVGAKCMASLRPSSARTSVGRYYENLKNRYIIDRYLCEVVDELAPITKYLYAGTMMIGMPFMWLKKIPKDKIVFFWGLRSYYLTYYKRLHLKYETFSSKIISNYYLHNSNVRLFVSDEIIRKEFLELGFQPWQLVLRPERVIDKCSGKSVGCEKKDQDSICNILCIGSLRPQKRVDLCMQALNELGDIDILFTIAGKASEEHGYSKRISELINGHNNIKRVDKRLSDEEYNLLINSCDYLLLCDEKQLSSVTNGTMSEALLAGKPIIAPDYDPYQTIVNKYGVGILYDINDPGSIQKALVKAENTDPQVFKNDINQFVSRLEYPSVLKEFKSEIDISLKHRI